MAISVSGILLPITTPFRSDETIDAQGLTSNIKKWNEAGITGYVVLGSTGQRVNPDERQYLEVNEIARRAVPDSMTFIVGAGPQGARATIEEIKRAATASAETAPGIPPHDYK